MVLQSEDLQGLWLRVALSKDTIYITNALPEVVIDVAGYLKEFLTDTSAVRGATDKSCLPGLDTTLTTYNRRSW